MNILDKTDEEVLEIAHPMWADLVKYSNEKTTELSLESFLAT